MAKRGNGEGSIFKDNTRNRWIGQYTIKTNEGTKRKSIYGATRSEVSKKLNAITNEINNGFIVNDSIITLQDWIVIWIEEYKKLSIKRTSIDNYYRYYNAHIKNSPLGKTSLKKVSSMQIQKFINEKSKNGKIDGSGGLRRSSVKHIFNVLYGSLNQAVNNNMLVRNPCLAVTLPKKDKQEILFFTPDQAIQFLDSVKNTKYYLLYSIALVSGLRLGEIIALRWENIDLEKKQIYVRLNAVIVSKEMQIEKGVLHSEIILQSPKTAKSKRTLYIDDRLASMLKNLRNEQLYKNETLGDVFVNSGFVFTNDYGKTMHPRSIQDHFKRSIKKANLPDLHFHCLRHSAASIMLFNGVNIKTVQEILGHEDIQTTLNIYSHVMEQTKQNAQETIFSSLTIHKK